MVFSSLDYWGRESRPDMDDHGWMVLQGNNILIDLTEMLNEIVSISTRTNLIISQYPNKISDIPDITRKIIHPRVGTRRDLT